MPSCDRKLVLFDIDGTLISDNGASREAFADALSDVYGFRGDLRRYDFSGRTDPQIARMILRDDERSDDDIDSQLPLLWQHYLGGLARNAPGRVRMLPGIPALLDALSASEHLTLALLTGNIEPGARLKLGAISLNDHFPFGAFGSDSSRREELPPIAAERATDATGHAFKGRDIVIIGDSIYDVRCGVPHGAMTIAIASGKTPVAMLRAENPDHFFESAEDLEGIVAAITLSASLSS
ncbi:MAG: phosphoglycolate phosphatase [Thermoanaerobaculia bacterium]|jgi:phosphoglycolate phosphatase-like HAD superfamily hydrolase|nr:phosphoglycolate phosphatase [Thermoanaerobaculia bacterium]